MGEEMKLKRAVLACGLAFGLVGLVRAETARKSMDVSILSDTSLNGTTIPAGRYKIAWTEQSSETDVSVSKNGKVVAQAHAKIVELKAPAFDDSIVSRRDAKGTESLVEIRFRGKKNALVISES
jgi:hypothetical protein